MNSVISASFHTAPINAPINRRRALLNLRLPARRKAGGATGARLLCVCGERDGAVLVTGAAGFIGSHVVQRLLRDGASVIAVDNFSDRGGPYPGAWKRANAEWLSGLDADSGSTREQGGGSLRFLEADITDRAAVENVFSEQEQGISHVCHLAGISGVASSLEAPEACIAVNVGSTALLMDCAGRAGCRSFVFASSGSVYGEPTATSSSNAAIGVSSCSPRPVKEEEATGRNLLSPYAASKMSAELLAPVYHNVHGLPITALRVFTVYGPRGRPDMAVQRFVEKILAGEPIQQFGTGASFRDYVYVEDVARAFITAMFTKSKEDGSADAAASPPRAFNIAGGKAVTLSELIKLVEEATGREAVVQVQDARAADVTGTFACIDEAAVGLGWTPEVSMLEGLRRTVDWTLQERDAWLKQHPSQQL